MTLDKNVVIKALEGVLLIENPVLWEDNKPPTKEHYEAIKIVLENKDEFHQIVLNEIQLYPNTSHFFRNLTRLRLRQDKPLSSPLIQSLFPLGPIDLEKRLQRIAHIPNIQKITKNAGPPESFDQGYETDELIKDRWAEFYVADLLVLQRKVEPGKLVHHLIRAASWIRICKPSDGFQSKICVNPSDSYPIFAEISLLPSCRLSLAPRGKNRLIGTFYSTLCVVIIGKTNS